MVLAEWAYHFRANKLKFLSSGFVTALYGSSLYRSIEWRASRSRAMLLSEILLSWFLLVLFVSIFHIDWWIAMGSCCSWVSLPSALGLLHGSWVCQGHVSYCKSQDPFFLNHFSFHHLKLCWNWLSVITIITFQLLIHNWGASLFWQLIGSCFLFPRQTSNFRFLRFSWASMRVKFAPNHAISMNYFIFVESLWHLVIFVVLL